jgi:uncharacterized protein (TIGR02145 family)
MNKHLFLSTIFMIAVSVCFSQQYGTFKDPRDGRVNKTVKIGNQIWMAENLNTDRFRNGDIIPEAQDFEDWVKACSEKRPAWCYSDFGPLGGKLYNYYAAVDTRGIAPIGWKIPSEGEWITLIKYFPTCKSGVELKSIDHWSIDDWSKCNGLLIAGNGTNKSGFNAKPIGSRCAQANTWDLIGEGLWATFWTSTVRKYKFVYLPVSFTIRSVPGISGDDRGRVDETIIKDGLSIRCIKY